MSDKEQEGKAELISGITRDANIEAESLIANAKQYVAERLAATETKLAEIKKEADEKLAKQTQEINKSIHSGATVEKRRLALKIREKIISEILAKVKVHLTSLVGSKNYQEILSGWILEAAVGLNTKEATVNASKEELSYIDPKVLSAIEKKAEELSGKKVKLQPEKEEPLTAQGVVLTAGDKRTAFNNQVQTRMLRYQSEIRKLIYDTLFKD